MVLKTLRNVDDPFLIAGYAFDFGSETILGHYLENIMGIDSVVIRVFNSVHFLKVVKALKKGCLFTISN